ncbi:MAG: 30S ribosomal protein S4 [Nanoarchaeota archaeon]|nr:30S ribosomal protein S4 [Nanoarchaeota archaeon]
MKRKHKQYSRPKRPFDKVRIDEEADVKKQYGLKNKREIWRAESKIRLMRRKAKKLIKAEKEEQEVLFQRLQKKGFEVKSIADILGLDKTDYLKRRLQTIVFNKKLASTIKTARQMIVHKKVLIDGKVVNIPSYIVPVELENKITIKKKIIKPKIKEKKENVKEN